MNVFFVYCLSVANVTLSPLAPLALIPGTMSGNLSLVPFAETHWLLRDPRIAFLNLAGNVVLFIPFGALLPLLSSTFRRFWATVLAGMLASVAIEALQWNGFAGGGARSADIDDVILNTVGTALGYAVYAVGRPLWLRLLGRRN